MDQDLGSTPFLLITDDELQLQVDDPLQRILAVFPQAIAAMEIANHRESLRGYLEHCGFKPNDEGEGLILRQQAK